MPIGCGGVPVFPGDIMVGDGEGVVVIPANIAEEVAHDAAEQDLFETFVTEKVREGPVDLRALPARRGDQAGVRGLARQAQIAVPD